MPERRTNYLARIVALLALGLASLLVVATITTSGGSGDGDGGGGEAERASGPTKAGERALAKGVWIVRSGDTLVFISGATGIELDELVELNPDIDPQALIAGQRISLRAGTAGEGSSGTETTATDPSADPADEFGDGSVDGDN